MSEVAELAESPAAKKEKKIRRQYDLSVMEVEQPQLVSLVAWLVTIPGMSYLAIQERAGMAWETVAAIAARKYDVSEWRSKAAEKVALVLEAATPGLLKRAAQGRLNAFEFKQLVDAWSQLTANQGSQRPEHTVNINVKVEAELYRMVDASRAANGLVYESGEVRRIGSHSQKLHALPVEADPIQAPDEVRECEELRPNSQDIVTVQRTTVEGE